LIDNIFNVAVCGTSMFRGFRCTQSPSNTYQYVNSCTFLFEPSLPSFWRLCLTQKIMRSFHRVTGSCACILSWVGLWVYISNICVILRRPRVYNKPTCFGLNSLKRTIIYFLSWWRPEKVVSNFRQVYWLKLCFFKHFIPCFNLSFLIKPHLEVFS